MVPCLLLDTCFRVLDPTRIQGFVAGLQIACPAARINISATEKRHCRQESVQKQQRHWPTQASQWSWDSSSNLQGFYVHGLVEKADFWGVMHALNRQSWSVASTDKSAEKPKSEIPMSSFPPPPQPHYYGCYCNYCGCCYYFTSSDVCI